MPLAVIRPPTTNCVRVKPRIVGYKPDAGRNDLKPSHCLEIYQKVEQSEVETGVP